MSQIAEESKHTQVIEKEGIRKYGERVLQAVLNKCAKLDNKATFSPKYNDKLTKEQKRDAANFITIIKEKRCGKIKGSACADGQKQWRYIATEDAAHYTTQLESLSLSLVMTKDQ